MSRIRILVASRSEAAADAVKAKLQGRSGFEVSTRVILNGHADPLHDVNPLPNLLILHHVPGYGELEHLTTLSANRRVPLLVFGPAGDPNAMRLAMRAGASDYLPEPLSEKDLLHSVDLVCEDLSRKPQDLGRLISVINSKGGSGASFIAGNIACELAQEASRQVALIDLDLQFGGLARYLDLTPQRGLLEALGAINEMDEVSAEAYVTTHKSGLKVLAAPSDGVVMHTRIAAEQVDLLLQVFLQNNDQVVVDLPRSIDPVTLDVLDRSDRMLLVVQQSLAHINGAAKLLQILQKEVALRQDRVDVVVNRFAKNSIIEIDDIRKTLRVDDVHVIPNQYKLVSESIDTGKPVVESARGSAVAKALRELAMKSSGLDEGGKRRGFLGRALPNFMGAN